MRKQKGKVYCGECEHYSGDIFKCNKFVGMEDTPFGIIKQMGRPFIDNENNNCQYYEQKHLGEAIPTTLEKPKTFREKLVARLRSK